MAANSMYRKQRNCWLILIITSLLLNKISTQQSICRIETITKYRDPHCQHQTPNPSDDLDHRDHLNHIIATGSCQPAHPPPTDDQLKLKIDCLGTSEIQFRFYNMFGDDESCELETESGAVPPVNPTISVADGSCTQMSNGAYYKFRIVPGFTPAR